ncbi:MAG: hypothetical protein IKB04_09630 [Clostridia bacterium]|nr:hypothetical protein [Clostridia bacterium]MBR2407276.1 hypothetical protein [Clostridia bacterium]
MAFNSEEYKKQLAAASSLDVCDKVPLPEFDREKKTFVFISYARVDYKQVYADLADLYDQNVRFFYDRHFTAGEAWDDDAQAWIQHPNCRGVIFYLSESMLRSSAIYREVQFTRGCDEHGKPVEGAEPKTYFCVKLAQKSPQQMLGEAFAEGCVDLEKMTVLAEMFPQSHTYVKYQAAGHTETLLRQIGEVFGVVESDEQVFTEAGEYSGDRVGDVPHGVGTMTYKDGSVYRGSWRDGKRHGHGEYRWSNRTYVGDWCDDMIEGRGRLTYDNGASVDGEWKQWKAHGHIHAVFCDGFVYDGMAENGKRNGFGRLVYNDGAAYEGNWKDGERHGRGVMTYADSSTYEGDWKSDKRHGKGKLVKKTKDQYGNESEVVYDGDWRDDEPCGHARVEYDDGTTYIGSYKNGAYNGFGRLEESDDCTYEGEWKDGKRHGRGVYVDEGEDTYEGTWQNGVLQLDHVRVRYSTGSVYEGALHEAEHGRLRCHGRGKMTYKSGDAYDGEWVNDQVSGHGTYTWKNGDVYSGAWVNDQKCGHGTYTWTDGEVYTGDWKNGRRHGRGKMTYADGDVYDGMWVNGKREGSGTYYWKSGDRFEGQWENGERNGPGRYIFADGRVNAGYWKDGKEIG